MPEHRECISCGRRVYHVASSARGGTTCRSCRVRLCLTCGKPIPPGVRSWSPWCSGSCNTAYWKAFYNKEAS